MLMNNNFVIDLFRVSKMSKKTDMSKSMKKQVKRFILENAKSQRKPRKIILIGPMQCGKTSLVNRFVDNTFTLQYKPSGEEFYNRDYTYRGYNLSLDIVDMSGKCNSIMVRDLHIKTADVIMLFYEVDNLKSVIEAHELYKTVREIREDRMPLVLVGTKADLKRGSSPPENFQQSDEIVIILNKIQGAKHILTSAKYNMQVKDAFECGLDDVIKRIHTLSMSAQHTKLSEYEKIKQMEKHCCQIL